ncbi:MAG TPA: ferritin-like domain-containing protein [Elusimicrobiota bacterium]|nr:ferritin-like domain-containing protein [Elusimicrobiota bacterium]
MARDRKPWISKDRLVRRLQDLLAMEYEDVFLYMWEASLFKKRLGGGDSLHHRFSLLSSTEMRHADRLVGLLISLELKPIWDFKTPRRIPSVRESLNRHLEREFEAIRIYQELVEETGEWPHFQTVLKGILEDEKNHLKVVRHMIRGLGAGSGGPL